MNPKNISIGVKKSVKVNFCKTNLTGADKNQNQITEEIIKNLTTLFFSKIEYIKGIIKKT